MDGIGVVLAPRPQNDHVIAELHLANANPPTPEAPATQPLGAVMDHLPPASTDEPRRRRLVGDEDGKISVLPRDAGAQPRRGEPGELV